MNNSLYSNVKIIILDFNFFIGHISILIHIIEIDALDFNSITIFTVTPNTPFESLIYCILTDLLTSSNNTSAIRVFIPVVVDFHIIILFAMIHKTFSHFHGFSSKRKYKTFKKE